MKKLISIFLVLLLIPVVLAQADELPSAGTLPSSGFYFIDVAIDRARVLLKKDLVEKAELKLEIAEERLAEAKKEAERENYYSSQIAMAEHQKEVDGVLRQILT